MVTLPGILAAVLWWSTTSDWLRVKARSEGIGTHIAILVDLGLVHSGSCRVSQLLVVQVMELLSGA